MALEHNTSRVLSCRRTNSTGHAVWIASIQNSGNRVWLNLRFRICSVRWSVDGRLLVSGHANGNLCFWDVKNTRKPVHEIAGLHTQMIVSVSIGLHTGTPHPCRGCPMSVNPTPSDEGGNQYWMCHKAPASHPAGLHWAWILPGLAPTEPLHKCVLPESC